MPTSSLRRLSVAALLPLLLLAGCNSNPKTLRVTGSVKQAGKPVPDLFVHFEPREGRPSWGITDAEGRFTLSYEQKRPGAIPGKHHVWFEYRPRDPKQDMDYRNGTLKLAPEFTAILTKYNQKDSPLNYEIASDGQVIDILLD